jgi:hypothetical protein
MHAYVWMDGMDGWMDMHARITLAMGGMTTRPFGTFISFFLSFFLFYCTVRSPLLVRGRGGRM